MKKVLLSLLILSFLFLPIISAEETHNVMIKYKDPSQLQSFFSTKSTFDIENIPKEKIRYEFRDTKYAKLTTKEINELKLNPNIIIQQEPTKQLFMQDAIYLTNSTNIWEHNENNLNITGGEETICIIDSGIDYNHSDFGNCYGNNNPNSSCKILGGWDYCADNTECNTEDSFPEDVNGHGTHVAGIASANGSIKGIAPESKLIILKVFNGTGSTYDTPILKGLDWCINNATKFNITTISMSLGNNIEHNSYCDNSQIINVENNPPYTERINTAKSKNITVVIATGNNGYTNGISSPACIENATRVGSITKSDLMSSFTNRDDFFTDLLLTYGTSINSTYPPSTYEIASGTSMSTPMAAGIISLLKQYKKLESNKNLTNDEVEEILINSSENYPDSPSNGNYSIINSYSAILYSDEKIPTTLLQAPQNNHLTTTGNTTFQCNASDNLQLKNLTLYIYNSTELFYNETNSSPTNNLLTINTTLNLSIADEYSWNCTSYDNQSNTNSTETRTLSTYSIQANIESPENNTFTNQNETTFNCSAQSSLNLTNITFSIYNSTNLLNTSTKNITGTSNYSTFNYNLTNETTYYYNCISSNEDNYSDSTKNYTITYDITQPIVSLTSPANNSRITSPVTFAYNETETNKDHCNLTINSNTYSEFTQTLTDGTYNWSVTCFDKAGNKNTSETFNLEIYTEIPDDTDTGGSSGGGSSGGTTPSEPTPEEYEIKENLTQGKQQTLKEKDSVTFTINSKEHKITLNKLEEQKAEITLESTPQNITLYLNSPRKINLDDDKTFDLELILLKTNNEAEIYIKEINEQIPTKRIFTNETVQKEQTEPTEELEKPSKKFVAAINYIIESLNNNQFKRLIGIII